MNPRNYGTLRKIEIIRNRCCWFYEEVLESFSEIISVKLRKNYEEILEKLRKNVGNTSEKLLKNILMKTLWNFQGKFCKNLQKIVCELRIILKKNCRSSVRKFWKYMGRSWKSVQGRLKVQFRTEKFFLVD